MSWIEVMPEFENVFREHGWTSAEAVLRSQGVIVNRHRDRRVEHVRFGNSESFYIKKDHCIRWRDRFRNAWHGFGWCANAVREAAMLQALAKNGIGCPRVAALGEAGNEAFVVLRDERDKVDLRDWLRDERCPFRQSSLADALGRMLAKMHDAGFAHPDLFAKHVLVNPESDTAPICILDWQRARYSPGLSWHARRRDLSLLDATLHETLASNRLRLRCLRAYRDALADRAACPPLARLAEHVRAESDRLRSRRQIRDARQPPILGRDQQFVPMHGGRLLVVRTYLEEMHGRVPSWLLHWAETGADIPDADLDGSQRIWIEEAKPARNDHWALPELAHTLFCLQRFHVPGARLLAAARSSDQVLLLVETVAAAPLRRVSESARMDEAASWSLQADEIIEKIREAGLGIESAESWIDLLGVSASTDQVVLAHPERLIRDFTPWRGPASKQTAMR